MGIGALVGAGISAAGSLFGASKASSAATQAANAQVKAAQIASDTQKDFFGQAKNALQPYMNVGNNASYELQRLMSDNENGPAVPTMSQSDLENTPGYQFTLSQGLKATQNSAAMRGLGMSGAAIKGAANYATGLSDQTYNTRFGQAQQQFQDQVTNQTNSFNKLYQTAGLGLSAGGALAGEAVKTGTGIATSETGAGSAQAAGINAAGQYGAAGITGVTGGFNNALNQYLATNSNGLYGGGSSPNSLVNKLGNNFLNGGMP